MAPKTADNGNLHVQTHSFKSINQEKAHSAASSTHTDCVTRDHLAPHHPSQETVSRRRDESQERPVITPPTPFAVSSRATNGSPHYRNCADLPYSNSNDPTTTEELCSSPSLLSHGLTFSSRKTIMYVTAAYTHTRLLSDPFLPSFRTFGLSP